MKTTTNEKAFYDKMYAGSEYAVETKGKIFEKRLKEYISMYGLENKKGLEVGSGRGLLQDVIEDYTGMDLAGTAKKNYHKRFVEGSASDMPFDDNEFDFAWSVAVLEHVPELEKACNEMIRVLRPGSHLILAPAWHCRKWAAQGYQVRPYSDFGLAGKIYKFMIPFLDLFIVRAIPMLVKRITVWFIYLFSNKPIRLYYEKLNANYEVFWQADSDACNAIDPFMLILWFESRGHRVVSHKTWLKKFMATHEEIDILIK